MSHNVSHNVKPLGFQCGVFSSFEPFYAILGADVVLWALWCSGATAQCDFKTLHVYFSVRTEINLCQLCNSSIQFPHVNAKAAKSLAAFRFTEIYQETLCSNAIHHMWHHTAIAVPMSDPAHLKLIPSRPPSLLFLFGNSVSLSRESCCS